MKTNTNNNNTKEKICLYCPYFSYYVKHSIEQKHRKREEHGYIALAIAFFLFSILLAINIISILFK